MRAVPALACSACEEAAGRGSSSLRQGLCGKLTHALASSSHWLSLRVLASPQTGLGGKEGWRVMSSAAFVLEQFHKLCSNENVP